MQENLVFLRRFVISLTSLSKMCINYTTVDCFKIHIAYVTETETAVRVLILMSC